MCLRDPLLLDEYRNPLIELAKPFIFVQQQTTSQQVSSSSALLQQQLQQTNAAAAAAASSDDSLFVQLMLYWTSLLNDARHVAHMHVVYAHALDTIKCAYLSSVEWRKSVAQSVIGVASLPWLAAESSAPDLDSFKTYRSSSHQLVINTDKATMSRLKRTSIQLLCMLPKNVSSQVATLLSLY